MRNWALKLSYLSTSPLVPPPQSTPWLNVDKSQHDMTSARSFKRWTVAFHTHSLYELLSCELCRSLTIILLLADSFRMVRVVEFIIALLQRDQHGIDIKICMSSKSQPVWREWWMKSARNSQVLSGRTKPTRLFFYRNYCYYVILRFESLFAQYLCTEFLHRSELWCN